MEEFLPNFDLANIGSPSPYSVKVGRPSASDIILISDFYFPEFIKLFFSCFTFLFLKSVGTYIFSLLNF